MICSKCGYENADDAMYCKKCGTKIGTEENIKTTIDTDAVKKKTGEITDKIKKLPKGALIGIIAAAAVLIVCIAVGFNNANTINMNEYLTMSTSGYNGYGTAKLEINWDAIEKKYGNSIKPTNKGKKELQNLEALGISNLVKSPISLAEEVISVKLDKSEGLSNGDEVSYTWNIDETLYEYVNVKLKATDGKFKISDLKEVNKIDAFEGVTVTFDGLSPNGRAYVNADNSKLRSDYFALDKREGLRNGDTVTVTISKEGIERMAKDRGEVPAENTKTFTVAGLASSLESIDQLSDDTIKALQKQTKDIFDAYVANNWADTTELKNFEYAGMYLLTPKSSNSYSTNKLYVIYKVTARNFYSDKEESFDRENTHYWFACFDQVKADENGNVDVNELKYSTPSHTFVIDSGIDYGWSTFYWTYQGYEKLDDLYKNTVTAVADQYKHEEKYVEGFTKEEATAETDTEIGTLTTKTEMLNIRKGPSETTEKIGNLSKGDKESVYEIKENDNYTWYRIGKDRWVADDAGNWVEYTEN